MAGPIQTLSYFARRVIQFEQKFAARPPARVQETAELFRSVGEGFDGLLDAFNDDAIIEPATESLKALLPQIETEVHAEVGHEEGERLSHALREALEPGRLRQQMGEADKRQTLIEELDKAAILVRALAD